MNLTFMPKIILLLALLPNIIFSQILFSDGATIFVNNGGILTSNGGFSAANGSNLTNDGSIRVTKNSTLSLPGTFTLNTASIVSGDGLYEIEQDWINDATFNAETSTVKLYGNTEQYITSTNNTITEFNNLILTGSGTGNDRKKTLLNVDAQISSTGVLTINDRECATQSNSMSVLNPSNTAVTNSLSFGNEGFVSSDVPGYLYWATNSTNSYNFPVGSSVGTTRYRPVTLTPLSTVNSEYAVRMNNVSADNYNYFLAQHDADISDANELFFHSIEQLGTANNADVSISYLASADGDWHNMGHWTDNTNLWNDMGISSEGVGSNYSYVKIANWDFSDGYTPFVLTNIADGLIIPNVFTPNQDGSNDEYFITGKGIIEYNIVIVNRWGEVVFESEDITQKWDGTTGGKLCHDGSYFYIIRAKSYAKDYLEQGHITLNAN